MSALKSRVEELRNDLENLGFSLRYFIGVLAELEQMGRTHTRDFKNVEKNVNTIKHNMRMIEAEIVRLENAEIEAEEEIEDPYYYSSGMAW